MNRASHLSRAAWTATFRGIVAALGAGLGHAVALWPFALLLLAVVALLGTRGVDTSRVDGAAAQRPSPHEALISQVTVLVMREHLARPDSPTWEASLHWASRSPPLIPASRLMGKLTFIPADVREESGLTAHAREPRFPPGRERAWHSAEPADLPPRPPRRVG